MSRQIHAPAALPPQMSLSHSTHWTEGQVGPRDGLDAFETRSFAPAGKRTPIPRLSNPQPSHQTDWAIPAPYLNRLLMTVKVSGQFRSTKMPRVLNVYREFWRNNEGFGCKYFIRKLNTDSYKLCPRQCKPKQCSGKCLENKTRNDIRSTLITSMHFFPSQHICMLPAINYNFS